MAYARGIFSPSCGLHVPARLLPGGVLARAPREPDMNKLSVRNSTAESLDANNLNVRKNEKSPSREPAIGMPSKCRMALGALALAMCLGLPSVSAAQDQPPQDQSSQPGESAGAPPSAGEGPGGRR